MSGNQISIEEYRKGSLILIRLIQIALSLEQKQFVIDENEYLWDIVYYLSQYNNVEGITYLGAKNVKNIHINIFIFIYKTIFIFIIKATFRFKPRILIIIIIFLT